MGNRKNPPNSSDVISRRSFLSNSVAAAGALGAYATTHAIAGDEPTTDRRIRIGVVGGGFGAAFPWHEHPNAVVTGVSDLRQDRRDRMMKVFNCPVAYDSLEKLIVAKDIDAVAVFTPAPDHARHVEMVLKAGKHAINAVPLANSLEGCERVLETVNNTGLTYMMAETTFYRQETITARQWYKEGKFGDIVNTEAEYYTNRADGTDNSWYERGRPSWRYGLSPMLYATHATAFLTGVTGERFTEVSCMGWGDDHAALKSNSYNNPFWNCTALCRTNRGHFARMSIFWNVEIAATERANWFGTDMNYYMADPRGSGAVVTTAEVAPKPQPTIEHWKTDMLPAPLRHNSGHGGSWTFVVHEFVDSLINRRRPAIDIYEALAESVPGIIAHQSALKGGELIKVPQYESTA